MDALKFFKQRNRICKLFYVKKCVGCPIDDTKNSFDSCFRFIFDNPDKAIECVEQWYKEHPQKTIMDDFFEKYPNAPKDDDGTPNACPYVFGYSSKCNFFELKREGCNCIECWSQPLEDYR